MSPWPRSTALRGCGIHHLSRSCIRPLALAAALFFGFACSDTPTDSGEALRISLDVEGSSLGPWSVTGPDSLSISLRPDTNADNRFWFSFRLLDGRNRTLTFRLEDALDAVSASNWRAKRPVASGDGGQTWTRIPDAALTEDGDFVFRHRPSSSDEWIALALPYNVSRWTDLVSSLQGSAWVESVETIGQSLDGNPVDLLEITDPSVPPAEKSGVWVVARQHPGEPEGSYMLEGFLEWLVGADPEAAELRRRARVFVAGFLDPDGVLAGNQRVNLAGLDLNRQWNEPDPATAPTIAAFQEKVFDYVDAGGQVRILVDFHSAPGARQNFFFYNEAATSTFELHAEVVELIRTVVERNPDFVPLEGSIARPVPDGERGRNWTFDRLQTHGLTVEASSNDVSYGPFQGQWVTEPRLEALGAAVGGGIAEVLYGIGSPLLASGTGSRPLGFPQ